jgi:lipopolysaccharide biosynthesis glycosyltransferase
VYDNYVVTQPLIGITEENEYFNSGVLLIDIPLWKAQRISEQCFDYLLKYPERIRFVDQCALNAVLKQNWKKLDWKFNVLYTWLPEEATARQLKKFIEDKYIIHFTLHRPWNILCRNRFRTRYFKYLKASPAADKSRYHDFSRNKIIPLLKLRILEMYMDSPYLKKLWRTLAKRNAS